MRPLEILDMQDQMIQASLDRREGYLSFVKIDPEFAHKFRDLTNEVRRRYRMRFNYNPLQREITIKLVCPWRNRTRFWFVTDCLHNYWSLPSEIRSNLAVSIGGETDRITGRYSQGIKEPACQIHKQGSALPSIVLEIGFLESYERLLEEKDMWIHGTSGICRVVVLIKYELNSEGKFEGFVEVWRQDEPDPPIRHPIFPKPLIEIEEPFFYFYDIYGGREHVPSGYNPDTELGLVLPELRLQLEGPQQRANLFPA